MPLAPRARRRARTKAPWVLVLQGLLTVEELILNIQPSRWPPAAGPRRTPPRLLSSGQLAAPTLTGVRILHADGGDDSAQATEMTTCTARVTSSGLRTGRPASLAPGPGRGAAGGVCRLSSRAAGHQPGPSLVHHAGMVPGRARRWARGPGRFRTAAHVAWGRACPAWRGCACRTRRGAARPCARGAMAFG